MIPLPPDPPPIIGHATVIDGDTLEVNGQRIRLWGIDAPEIRQTCEKAGRTYECGEESAKVLGFFVAGNGGQVSCTPRGRPDRYRRVVAVCTTQVMDPQTWRPFTVDLAERQVRYGLALDYPRYSAGAYATIEAQAHERRAGMWAGEFVRPWEWRGGNGR